MADTTAIAWTDHTFNGWLGCVKVSAGCTHCYAETLLTGRMGRPGLWGPAKTTRRQRTSGANWRKPVGWNAEAAASGQPRLVFSGSLCDVFEDHPDADAARPDLFALIRKTPYLHWQLLTKRPENIVQHLPDDWGTGYDNVWLGTSIEDMRVAHRADVLRGIPARVHFISAEPLLGSLSDLNLSGIEWLITGGESGPGFRPMDWEWVRELRRACERSGTAFFHKQGAAPRTEMFTTLDGETVRNYPAHAWWLQGTAQ